MIRTSAESQKAEVEQATYFQYTKEDPTKALASLFQREKGPNAKTDFLFFSGSALTKVGFDVPSGSAIEKISTDMIILDEKNRRPVFATGVSLLVPAK